MLTVATILIANATEVRKRSFHLFCWVFIFFTVACQPSNKAQQLIDEAIEAHGGAAYDNKRIEFDFRQFHLVLENRGGNFRYERTQRDSPSRQITDVLTNTRFVRIIDGLPQPLDSAAVRRYSQGVNSIAYFVLLPQKLSDPAVVADYVGTSQIDGQTYHKVRIRFRAEGGGTDYTDTFFYWFNQQTHTMDFLAYSEGGPRFRKAINPQVVSGIRFQDYINYKGETTDTTSVGNYDTRYQARQLTELSRIEQKNIRVSPLP